MQHDRQAVLGQPATLDAILKLQPVKLSPPQCGTEDKLAHADATSTDSSKAAPEAALTSFSTFSNSGVQHVGWLRAGNMRQPVVVLEDGTLLIYRENGEIRM